VHNAKNKPMKNLLILLLFLFLFLLSFAFDSPIASGINDKESQIKILWVDNLKGDFNFKTSWNYPEGVYRNKFGQLDCDGFCPDGIDSMKNSKGKIRPRFLTSFYQLIDTTHQFHSIVCKAWCYEWAGTEFITAKQTNKNQTICTTQTNAGTHCSLIFAIIKDTCIPRIELTSISAPGLKTYYCKGGFIKIEKDSWIKGILKAEFNFDFKNTDEPAIKMFWKGRIYKTIDKQ